METGKISYRHEVLHMAMPQAQIDSLLAQGTGGIVFDLAATSGGQFVFALYSPENTGAIVAFSVESGAPQVTRSLFLVPLNHTFNAPSTVDMCPLGALLHTNGMFLLYEIKQAGN